MTVYRTRDIAIQAVQLTDGALYYPHEVWVVTATLAAKLHLEKRPMEVHTGDKGIQYAQGDDWLVHTLEGEIYVVPNMLFWLLFEIRD